MDRGQDGNAADCYSVERAIVHWVRLPDGPPIWGGNPSWD